MPGKENIAAPWQSRRNFIGNTLKLAALGSLLIPVHQGCTNDSGKKKTGPEGKKKSSQKTTKSRSKWNYEKLIVHTKTNVVHFPTRKFFNYYDKIDQKYIRELDINNWEQQVRPPLHFHKQHAAIILELLALQKLVSGISADALSAAEKTLSIAFSRDYENASGQNIHYYSFRLHDFLLKCIALNPSIPVNEKWNRIMIDLNNLVYRGKEAGAKKGLPLRMRWLTDSSLFDAKVKWVADNQQQYTTKLQERVAKNRFI